jgi:lincosamide nucleotidyltransferase A/C/D/E
MQIFSHSRSTKMLPWWQTCLVEQTEVLALYELLADHGIEVWLDGGWGIDALIGEQTRGHSDLDIAVRHGDVAELRQLLMARGYKPVEREGTQEWIFVLGDEHGHQVDVHSFIFDEHGTNIYGVQYPAEALTGTGSLSGLALRCIAADWAVRFHTAYTPRAVDRHDLKLLYERLNIDVPDQYKA